MLILLPANSGASNVKNWLFDSGDADASITFARPPYWFIVPIVPKGFARSQAQPLQGGETPHGFLFKL
jgi:hypothetical protein